MSTELLHTITVLGALAILAYYEVNRKFKEDKPKSLTDWLGIQWPRILFTIAIVPGAGKVFLEVVEKVIN